MAEVAGLDPATHKFVSHPERLERRARLKDQLNG
jgi:hypothetical protein